MMSKMSFVALLLGALLTLGCGDSDDSDKAVGGSGGTAGAGGVGGVGGATGGSGGSDETFCASLCAGACAEVLEDCDTTCGQLQDVVNCNDEMQDYLECLADSDCDIEGDCADEYEIWTACAF